MEKEEQQEFNQAIEKNLLESAKTNSIRCGGDQDGMNGAHQSD